MSDWEAVAVITDTFLITGRGLIATLDRLLPVAAPHRVEVTITPPEGSPSVERAYVEIICHPAAAAARSALMFPHLSKETLPVGSCVTVRG
jgi:hypothetical protein